MRNGLWVGLGVVVLAALIVFLARGGDERVEVALQRTPAPTVDPAPPNEPAAELPAIEAENAPEPSKAERIALPSAPATAPAPARDDESVATLVEGTLTLVDPDGTEHTDLDGALTLLLWRGRWAQQEDVEVVSGRWSLELDEPAEIGVGSIELDGTPALLADEAGRRYPTDQGPIALRARRPATMRLNVLDDSTGTHLGEVTVLAFQGWKRDDMQHPGAEEGVEMASAAHSPIELHPSTYQARGHQTPLLIHAPGYAWASLELDFSAGGERELRLQPAASLAIFLDGEGNRGAVLRLYDAEEGGRPYTELDAHGEDGFDLDGVRANTYRVALEIGDWWDKPLVQGEEEIELVAGQHAEMTLALTPPPEFEQATLAGLLIVPKEWELDRPRLSVELLGTPLDGGDGRKTLRWSSMEPTGDRDVRRWSAGKVQVGRHELWLPGINYSIAVDVPRSGLADVRFELPPPATVSVQLVDETTGLPAEVDSVHWHCKRPEGVRGGALSTVNIDTELQRFVFQAPQCTIQLSSWGGSHQPWSKSLAVGPGINELTGRLSPGCGVRFILRDGDTPVPWDEPWLPQPEHLDGEGRANGMQSSNGQHTIRLSEPGRYVFELPEFSGFAPVGKLEVSVIAGETLEHVVQLERVE